MNTYAEQLRSNIAMYQLQFDQAQQELSIANHFLITGSYANNQFVPIYQFASKRTTEYKTQIAQLQQEQSHTINQSQIDMIGNQIDNLTKKLNKQRCTPINMANQFSHHARLKMKFARIRIAKCHAKLAKISS